jgi:hypothetical protein
MKSPAQRHMERASAHDTDLPGRPSRHASLMAAKLATDQQRLKLIQSIERKLAIKKEILPDYEDYIAGVLEGQSGRQDDVLVTVMIWHIDTGAYSAALDIAAYALTHDLILPMHYVRTLATLITEEIAEAALAGKAISIDELMTLFDLVAHRDMPDPVRAKLHKALGWALQDTDPETALMHLRRALCLHPRCGVKKEIDRLEREQMTQAPRQNGAGTEQISE